MKLIRVIASTTELITPTEMYINPLHVQWIRPNKPPYDTLTCAVKMQETKLFTVYMDGDELIAEVGKALS